VQTDKDNELMSEMMNECQVEPRQEKEEVETLHKKATDLRAANTRCHVSQTDIRAGF
jgi:hypothetical protein